MKYRAEIDGLRAVAVIPVILFHAGLTAFGGGYVGVDVFFVISGYLITSIIIGEIELGKFSLAKFYERRARRILPALIFVVVACFPPAWFLFLSSDFFDFSASALAVATFWSNFFFWQQSGYFAPAAELQPLLHTWSLAVEEQFYILFPLFLMASWRFGKRSTLSLLALGFIVSLAAAQWGAYNSPEATFFLLPTRAWELLLGSFVAFLLHKNEVRTPQWLNNALSALGLIAILYAVFTFDEYTPFPSLFGLAPTIGAVLIIVFALPGTLVNSLLSSKLFVGIGLISYSLYLWHQPIFAFARYSVLELTAFQILTAIVVTIGAALVSYFLVEKPFRYRAFKKPSYVFFASLSGSLVVIALSLLGTSVEKAPRYQFADYQEDRNVLRKQSWEVLRALTEDPRLGTEGNKVERELWFSENDKRHNLLVVGNSHSKDVFNLLSFSSFAHQHFELARFGVQIRDIDGDFFNLPNYTEADIVVIASLYSDADLNAVSKIAQQIVKDGKKLVLVPQIYSFKDNKRFTAADILIMQCLRRINCETDQLVHRTNRYFFTDYQSGAAESMYSETLGLFSEIASGKDEIVVLDRMDYVCDLDDSSCFAIDSNLNKFFYDYGHHTVEGARFFARQVDEEAWLSPLIRLEQANDF